MSVRTNVGVPSIDDILASKVTHELSAKQFILICVYFPPSGSPMLSHDDDYFDCLHEIIASRNQLPVFLCGDFNARTGDLRTEILHADIVEEQSTPLAALQNENPDDVKNFRGRNLIRFCSAHGLAIVNGLHYNDTVFTGGFTCFPHNGGKSTVDYIICDIESLDQVRSFEIFGSMSHSSDHLPIAVN